MFTQLGHSFWEALNPKYAFLFIGNGFHEKWDPGQAQELLDALAGSLGGSGGALRQFWEALFKRIDEAAQWSLC